MTVHTAAATVAAVRAPYLISSRRGERQEADRVVEKLEDEKKIGPLGR